MFYIIRKKISITTSDEHILNLIYEYYSVNRVIETLLREGRTYRTETIS